MKTQILNQSYELTWQAGRILPVILVIVLVLVVGLWSIGAILKSNMLKQYPLQGQMVDVDGHKMHIHCLGEGSPTVILEAGLDDFSIFWSQVQPEAARFTRVCSYDRAGLGWSESSPDPRTSETMVKELHFLLVKANIDAPYVLVGHSFGGALMRLYAHHYPDEVAGMVLVDAAPDDLFTRIPRWENAIAGKLGFYRILAPLSSSGLLAFVPENIPNRGLPDDGLAQYRAIAVSTEYFQTAVAENEAFENNLAEVRTANVSLGDMPLIVISRGRWEPMPGFSKTENQQAWQTWQEMQSELLSLSSDSRQIVATKSEHNIQLQQPQLVTEALKDVVEVVRK
jgi:pimeloyl-ACP methyl ester carboxylesterase